MDVDTCDDPSNYYRNNRCCAICEISKKQCRREADQGSSWCWQHKRTCTENYKEYKKTCDFGQVNPLPGVVIKMNELVKGIKIDVRPDPKREGKPGYFLVKDDNYNKLISKLKLFNKHQLEKLRKNASDCNGLRHWNSNNCHTGTCSTTKKAKGHYIWQAKLYHLMRIVDELKSNMI